MGPYQSTPTTTKHHTPANGVIKYKNIRAVASDMQGWRNGMEDSHILATNIDNTGISIFGVFDGHGGKEVAKYVEAHFIEEIKQMDEFKNKQFDEALVKSFKRMDDLMESSKGQLELNRIRADPDDGTQGGQSYAGCTANVALFYDNQLWVANAGDSRSVLCRDNKPYPMSEDHKPEDQKEKARISAAGGFVHEGRVNGNLNLSRALGDLEYKNNKDRAYDQQLIICKPDVTHIQLGPDDKFLLMGCDGIWECKSNEDLIDFVNERLTSKMEIQQINTQLLDTILAPDTSTGTGCDNMSVIIVDLKGE